MRTAQSINNLLTSIVNRFANRHKMTETICKIEKDNPACPVVLHQAMLQAGFSNVWILGDPVILETPLLGLFCSKKCPGDLIIKTFDAVRQMRDAGVPMIGGFHSSMEKECLDLLLRGKQPVVICPARSIEGMRIPGGWKRPMAEGRLLVLSPFEGREKRRVTAELARERNRFVASLSHAILVPHAAPEGVTEQLCMELLKQGKPVYTFDSKYNTRLMEAGATVRIYELLRNGLEGTCEA
jgi:predicted Rossmann fold nucleotide-binding protein DprA/Smf involved in DNA uptake